MNTAYKVRTKAQREDVLVITEQINSASNDIARGRELLLKDEIEANDFREIKLENERRINVLKARLIEISKATTNIESMLEKAVTVLSHLNELYKDGDVRRKRAIIGSIYSEKLTFDGFQYRTTGVNEAVELI